MDYFNYYPAEPRLRELLLTHSQKVAEMALECAAAHPHLNADTEFIRTAAMLHDIGIAHCDAPDIFCFGSEPYIRHGIIGGEMLRKDGLDAYARVCERHTGAGLTSEDIERQKLPLPHKDYLPETVEEKMICYADKFYSKSGDPTKRKDFDKVAASMARHGQDTLKRFLQLHNEVGIANS